MSGPMQDGRTTPSRRDLFALIGTLAGSAAMYHAMTSLGFAADSTYRGPIELAGDVKGASVLVLGAGLAGMTAALELRRAGYRVKVLEFNSRAGGRNWTLRGGDSFTELGGFTQACAFEPGLYFNPGPWRIPYHHRALLDYCRRLNVALEPFVEINHNAFLHASGAFGGRPQRIRDIKADFQGGVAELLAKATQQGELDRAVSREDKEILLEALRSWGALDENYAYRAGLASADARGFAKPPGGGLGGAPVPGEPIGLSEILQSRLWRFLQIFAWYELQTTMFQPVGGMDMIGKAFAREVGDLIRYDAKVTRIKQSDRGVAVTYVDTKKPDAVQTAQGRLVRLHHSALHSQPDRDRRRRPHEGGDRRGALSVRRQDRPAVQAPVLGRRRRHLWRHQLHQSADPADRLPEHGLQSRRPRHPARRLCVRGRQLPTNSPRWRRRNAWRKPSSMARSCIRNTAQNSRTASPWPGIACRSRSAAPAAGARKRGRRITMISARSTAGSCLPASTRRIFPPGRRARSSRRSMRSPACTNVSSRRKAVIRWGTRCDVEQMCGPGY